MPLERSLIAPTADPRLEGALRDKLAARSRGGNDLGALLPLALRIGLVQKSLKPQLHEPQLVVFAGDHGLAVERIAPAGQSTAQWVDPLLSGRLPMALLAQQNGLALSVVDAGMADPVPNRPQLMARKIAHGTRNCRVGEAMTVDQAHAAIRAGMEIADALPGNVLACAGLSLGGTLSAALVLSQLGRVDLRSLLAPQPHPEEATRLHTVLHVAQTRHQRLSDPVEVVAAVGGFEMAMLAGAMLVAASKRHLLVVDGLVAAAALMVAAQIAPTVVDYCVFCRSNAHPGMSVALALFGAEALPHMGLDALDGTGMAISWPTIAAAAGLLNQVPEGDDAGPTVPEGVSRLSHDGMDWDAATGQEPAPAAEGLSRSGAHRSKERPRH